MDPVRRKAINDAVVRLSDGDRSACRVLVDELWPVILAFAQRGVHHEQDAEDVAQEVFLRICSRISDFDRERDGLSWAFGIASYEVMSHRRRQQRARVTLDEDQMASHIDPARSPEEGVIQSDIMAALTQAIGVLSEEDRVALELAVVPRQLEFAVQGPTLRKRRQRALGRLRTIWRSLNGRP
jgi:RNA polymerase sigma-70 factor, ECF subfamily